MACIRPANVRDASAIAHVHVQSWLTTYAGIVPRDYLASLNEAERARAWEKWLASGITVFVAEVSHKVVGFAGGGPAREPVAPYDAELYTLYLLQNEQKRGLGKALLVEIARSLRQGGHHGMLVWVLAQNPAVRFYEKSGAYYLREKQTDIGGASLTELALGWPDLKHLARNQSTV
jgi:GNAT superfamily N-acetyltransferase